MIVHEVAHGLAALSLGDTTAKDAGRLTLNPLKHLDFFGSFLLPFSLYFLSAGTFVFGWAKPVPFNPLNLKNPKKGAGLIALAGPLSNFVLALVAALILRLGNVFNLGLRADFLELALVVNLSLMVVNLFPIPPLDGSKILFALLPQKWEHFYQELERFSLFLILIFLFVGFRIVGFLVSLLIRLLT